MACKDGDIHKATKILYGKSKVSKLSKGVNINFQNAYGLTPLHWAVVRGDRNMVQMLLDCGADWNIPNVNGQTAENIAATQTLGNLIAGRNHHHHRHLQHPSFIPDTGYFGTPLGFYCYYYY